MVLLTVICMVLHVCFRHGISRLLDSWSYVPLFVWVCMSVLRMGFLIYSIHGLTCRCLYGFVCLCYERVLQPTQFNAMHACFCMDSTTYSIHGLACLIYFSFFPLHFSLIFHSWASMLVLYGFWLMFHSFHRVLH